jgi:hypothetical protein
MTYIPGLRLEKICAGSLWDWQDRPAMLCPTFAFFGRRLIMTYSHDSEVLVLM